MRETAMNADATTARKFEPSLALEAPPDKADLCARATAGDPSSMLTLLKVFQDELASLTRAVDWLHGLALENHKLEVAARIDQWRDLCGLSHAATGAEK
jgi:hypothetical protein